MVGLAGSPVPFSAPWCCSTGYVEDRRVHVGGIGKYRLVDGLTMQFKGVNYCILAYFNADNDHVKGGNPQEMVLLWSPGIPEALSRAIVSAINILASLLPPGFRPNSSESCKQQAALRWDRRFLVQGAVVCICDWCPRWWWCIWDFLVAGNVVIVIVRVVL